MDETLAAIEKDHSDFSSNRNSWKLACALTKSTSFHFYFLAATLNESRATSSEYAYGQTFLDDNGLGSSGKS